MKAKLTEVQQRLKKYSRDAETYKAVANRKITNTSLEIIATIHDYKIVPTSSLVRLVKGHPKNTNRHLQVLYHKGLINRFAFMRGRTAGEFHYYLDNTKALDALVAHGVESGDLEFEEVRRNRDKRYCDINDVKGANDNEGRLLFLRHEVMISRFHALVELACKQSHGTVALSVFKQGPILWDRVEAPKLVARSGEWMELSETEKLPHRPDAFFTLEFPQSNIEPRHFFYEADRHRTSSRRYNLKLRAYVQFIIKAKCLPRKYGIDSIHSVLTESTDDEWTDYLRLSTGVIPGLTSDIKSLFWFTSSRTLERLASSGLKKQETPFARPEVIFGNVWANPVNNILHSLIG